MHIVFTRDSTLAWYDHFSLVNGKVKTDFQSCSLSGMGIVSTQDNVGRRPGAVCSSRATAGVCTSQFSSCLVCSTNIENIHKWFQLIVRLFGLTQSKKGRINAAMWWISPTGTSTRASQLKHMYIYMNFLGLTKSKAVIIPPCRTFLQHEHPQMVVNSTYTFSGSPKTRRVY